VSSGGGAPVDAVLAEFRRAEAEGLATAWLGQLLDHDALTLLALAGRDCRRIGLGSWVVPTPPRHPAALAQQALTLQAACGGRLVLGIGVSHDAVVSKRLGLDASRPVAHAREYLAVLRPLLAGEAVEHTGARYRVSLRLEVAGAAPPPVLLAALGPKMLALAGAAADGAAIWLGAPDWLATRAIPAIREAADAAGRPPPRIACGLPVLVHDDARAARERVDAFLAPSARLPAYRAVLARAGAQRPGEVALVGNEAAVEDALLGLAEAGATDFNAVVVPGDAAAATRTRALLARLASQGFQSSSG
jgi:F420-dependent oxidoreductase-like protein